MSVKLELMFGITETKGVKYNQPCTHDRIRKIIDWSTVPREGEIIIVSDAEFDAIGDNPPVEAVQHFINDGRIEIEIGILDWAQALELLGLNNGWEVA